MLERLLSKLRRRPRSRPAPPAAPDADRASGEDARRTAEVFAEEASSPGTPRLKSKNL